MKGSLLWRLMYVFCVLAGLLAGYGVYTLTSEEEVKPNTNTKDNTLVRDSENSVFFDGMNEAEVLPTVPVVPIQAPDLTPTLAPEITGITGEEKPEPSVLPTVPLEPEEPVVSKDMQSVILEPTPFSTLSQASGVLGDLPSMASQWAAVMPEVIPTPVPVVTPSAPSEATAEDSTRQDSAAEVITYPAEIFGQVPVINRSDAYVSYFEFAYDLIEMLEPEVKARGLNMNSLLARFVIKALFCGVDIEKLDINAPIPRRLAALCLWLAAQVLGEEGCDTTARSAQKYVTDISGCSSAEKKAVAYLYEQGILKGYQTAGQRFYPDAGLATEYGSTWLSRVKQCWK